MGYGWFTDRIDGQEITWHNGGTGGFRSFMGFDRTTGRGVVVLANTDREVDTLGRHLLTGAELTPGGADAAGGPATSIQGEGPGWLAVVVTWFLSLAGGLGLLFVATRPVVDRLPHQRRLALAAPRLPARGLVGRADLGVGGRGRPVHRGGGGERTGLARSPGAGWPVSPAALGGHGAGRPRGARGGRLGSALSPRRWPLTGPAVRGGGWPAALQYGAR